MLKKQVDFQTKKIKVTTNISVFILFFIFYVGMLRTSIITTIIIHFYYIIQQIHILS
jgi:hypothetical protein